MYVWWTLVGAYVCVYAVAYTARMVGLVCICTYVIMCFGFISCLCVVLTPPPSLHPFSYVDLRLRERGCVLWGHQGM